MTKQFAKLQRIEGCEPITAETHGAFLHHLQGALLLALRESGTLTAMQYRYAEDTLRRQRLQPAKKNPEKGEKP